MNRQKNPLVSIIIPVYNVGYYLIKCLSSCIEQTYPYIEIVCVDDGSTDVSGELLAGFAVRDNRIKVLRQDNSGVVIARNNAISVSKGEYLFFLDADDYIGNNAIELLIDKSCADNSDVVIANLSCVYKRRVEPMCFYVPTFVSKQIIIEYLLLDQLPLSLGAKLIKKELFNDLKTLPELKIGEDAYITLQLVYKANALSFIENSVYFYVNRYGSATTAPSNIAIKSRILFIESVIALFNKIKFLRENSRFQNVMSLFVLNQYYAFLRMGGGTFLTEELKDWIERDYFSNQKSRGGIPYWRRAVIYLSLKGNKHLLNSCLFVINTARFIKMRKK